MSARRGLLLALEGADGTGKTVQAAVLAAALGDLGLPARVLREPGGTGFGERLRALVLDAAATGHDPWIEALLFSASRRALVVQELLPALARGETLVLDRSFLSTWVYQGLVGGLPLPELERLTRAVCGEAWPDRILLLELDPAERRRRRAGRGERDAFEDREPAFHDRVAAGFAELANRHPGLVRRVDASGSVEEVGARLLASVRDLVGGGLA